MYPNINYVAILHLSHKGTRTAKNGYVYKPFTIYFNYIIENTWVKIKLAKSLEKTDEYIVVKKNNNEFTIVNYICKIDDINASNLLLNELTKCNWNKIKPINITSRNDENRVNYIDSEIYTIDPQGCIDIDDAMHINDNKIYIHIADVSDYIEEGTALDNELKKRCESIYTSKISHMMTPELVDHFTLRENQIKKAYTVVFTYDDINECIIHVDFHKSLIKVKKNMSYEEAQAIIDCGLNNNLVKLYIIANKLMFNEIYDTHKMVEVYMILTNHYVAKQLCKMYDKCLLRRQNKLTLLEQLTNSEYSHAEYIYNNIDKDNTNHESLKLNCYTHFTSPIRRYADIITHRLLSGKECKIDDELIARLNFYKQHNKNCVLLEKLDNIYIDNNYIDVEGTVIKIKGTKCKVSINDTVIKVNIINKKMLEIITNNIESIDLISNDNEFRLVYDNKEYMIKLHQVIKIRMCKILNSMFRIDSYILFDD